ncbi:hypothetical protein BB559_001364 [Furculomyces boomerangus]|uniref:Sodium/calcium exchanger membrane region domain-containing protein n=1 Tax=Furculomyces boomerangus TaxID=61424 RepID=A0A2T9Z238_9FUNG|nr:hypothetical protein BB559_001364 [Furculomyces boomerangus]
MENHSDSPEVPTELLNPEHLYTPLVEQESEYLKENSAIGSTPESSHKIPSLKISSPTNSKPLKTTKFGKVQRFDFNHSDSEYPTVSESLYEENSADEDQSDELILEDDDDVKTRQEAMNKTHLFGLPIWKPALYKKSRSVSKAAFIALHSRPKKLAKLIANPGNILWLIIAGWWMALVFLTLSLVLFLIPVGGPEYARVLYELAQYIFWPFGKSVERIKLVFEKQNQPNSLSNNNETDSVSISIQSSSSRDNLINSTTENNHLLSDNEDDENSVPIKSVPRKGGFLGHFVYYTLFMLIINPILLLVSGCMWLFVFTIPMGSLTFTLSRYLWRDPLSLHFASNIKAKNDPKTAGSNRDGLLGWALNKNKSPTHDIERNTSGSTDQTEIGAENIESSSTEYDEDDEVENVVSDIKNNPNLLLCTNEAFGLCYYKYTVDGVNIIFINLMFFTLCVLFLAFVIGPMTNHSHPLTKPGVLFVLCLISTIPLAYFIGQAVSSISAQSSFGLGSVINATFGSIIEVILYSLALSQGKSEIVEGALIGSFLAGMLLMPGVSMIAGGIKYKEQKFNQKSAGVTATLIIMSIIAAFAPTLFYHTYGRWELKCSIDGSALKSSTTDQATLMNIGQCVQIPVRPTKDPLYFSVVRPFSFICAGILLTSYIIGLWFTLKSHVKHIYSSPTSESDRRAGFWKAIKKFVMLQTQNANNVSRSENHHLAGRKSNITSTYKKDLKSNYKKYDHENYHSECDEQDQRGESISSQDPTASTSKKRRYPEGSSNPRINSELRHRNDKKGSIGYTPKEGASPYNSHRTCKCNSCASNNSSIECMYEHRNSVGRKEYYGQGKGKQGSIPSIKKYEHRQPNSTLPLSYPSALKLVELPKILAADPDDQFPDLTFLYGGRHDNLEEDAEEAHGGHDAPNWSKTKSALILCVCTLLFSLVAEVLVDTVDSVISNIGLSEKMLGFTLFALVPTVTEFVNATAFAMQKNIELAIEISNAYTVQVSLLQIPILLFISSIFGHQINNDLRNASLSGKAGASITSIASSKAAELAELIKNGRIYSHLRPTNLINSLLSFVGIGHKDKSGISDKMINLVAKTITVAKDREPYNYVFTLVFSRWEVISAIFSVFMLTYMLIEGKSNYFKGSILCLCYLVWLVGFYFSPDEYNL